MKKSMCENEMCFGLTKEDELKLVKAIQETMDEAIDFYNINESCEEAECYIDELIDDAIVSTLDEVNTLLANHDIPLLVERCDHCDELLLFEIEE